MNSISAIMPQQATQQREQTAAPKIGQAHAAAWLRGGFKEIGEILPAFPDSVKTQDEMGLFGTSLPQEVFKERHKQEPSINQNLEMSL